MPRREEDYGELLYRGGVATIIASPLTMHTWSGTVLSVGGYTGKINKVQIQWGATYYAVPLTVPLNSSVEIHVWAKLDATSPAVKTGVLAKVTKPDGTIFTKVKEMITAQNPGQELVFAIPGFITDKAGTWTAVIEYYTIGV